MTLPLLFQPVLLPSEFTQLLSLDMTDDLEVALNIKTFLTHSPSMKMILARNVDIKNLEDNLEKWVRGQGWHQFRNNIAAIYLSKIEENVYLNDVNPKIIQRVLDIENKLLPFSQSNHSRTFLLSFFLKIHNHKYPKNKLELPIAIYRYLEVLGKRVNKIDYYVLMLWHFIHFFDEDKLDRLLKKDISNLDTFYDQLTIDHKEIFIRNFLHYTFSINEFDLFEKRVV